MVRSIRSVVGILALLMVGVTSAHAQHAGDLIVGSAANGGGALKISFDFSRKVVATPSFTSGGFTLYTTTDPGFDALVNDDPANAFYALDTNTPVRVELTAIAPLPPGSIFSMKFRTVTIDAVGESALDGTMPNLHYHPTWGLYLPNGVFADYAISFKLTTTAAGYSQSVPYTIIVTNVVPPTATPSATPTTTPVATATASATPTATATASATPTATVVASATPTATSVPTGGSPTATLLATMTPTPSATPVQLDELGAKCRAAVGKAASILIAVEAKAVRSCEEKVLGGKLPPDTVCRTEGKTAGAVAKARQKLRQSIGKACGGHDKLCGVGADDLALATIGWDVGTCTGAADPPCGAAVADCDDVATCVTCIGEGAVDEAVGLAYDAFAGPSASEKALKKCQKELGRITAALLAKHGQILAKCWSAGDGGDLAGRCESDPAVTSQVQRARDQAAKAVCKACGGPDKACGGSDDFTPAAIGFVASCPAVTPSGVAGCGGTVATLSDVVSCLGCVAAFDAECAAAGAVPWRTTFPTACRR